MTIPQEQRNVLEAMGIGLLLLQNAERVIRLCMTVVLQKQALTLNLFTQQEEAERIRTIGYFLAELRKRAAVHPTVDALLVDFLKNRNDFVHDLSRVPTWNLRTPEGVVRSGEFVHNLIRQTEQVIKVFAGLVVAWQEQLGMSEPSLPNDDWFSEIATVYKPLASYVFRAKNA